MRVRLPQTSGHFFKIARDKLPFMLFVLRLRASCWNLHEIPCQDKRSFGDEACAAKLPSSRAPLDVFVSNWLLSALRARQTHKVRPSTFSWRHRIWPALQMVLPVDPLPKVYVVVPMKNPLRAKESKSNDSNRHKVEYRHHSHQLCRTRLGTHIAKDPRWSQEPQACPKRAWQILVNVRNFVSPPCPCQMDHSQSC